MVLQSSLKIIILIRAQGDITNRPYKNNFREWKVGKRTGNPENRPWELEPHMEPQKPASCQCHSPQPGGAISLPPPNSTFSGTKFKQTQRNSKTPLLSEKT